MHHPSKTTETVPARRMAAREQVSLLQWGAFVLASCLFAAGTAMALEGDAVLAAGAIAAATALAISWGLPVHHLGPWANPLRRRLPRRRSALWRLRPDDRDLYLDLDAVEVEAVYLLGAELFAHLRGGVGCRRDPVTGDQRQIETSDVALTWRCAGKRAAGRLAAQLNRWEGAGTPLRLLAACGRSALLIEDDDNWVVLPELRLTT